MPSFLTVQQRVVSQSSQENIVSLNILRRGVGEGEIELSQIGKKKFVIGHENQYKKLKKIFYKIIVKMTDFTIYNINFITIYIINFTFF